MSTDIGISHEVLVTDPEPMGGTQPLPDGQPRTFQPSAVTLISGRHDAVLVDPPLTREQAERVGDWVEASGKRLMWIVATHGHGDHWFTAGMLAERFGARVAASAGTIAQMHHNTQARGVLWDVIWPDRIPPSPVTAVTVPGDRLSLEGHDLAIVDVGHADSDDSTVLHVPDLDLVVAGDTIYNGVHMYLADSADGNFGPWRKAIDTVAALGPRRIVAGHQNRNRDDDAQRLIAETRRYLDDAEAALAAHDTPVEFFDAMIGHYPEHLGRTVLWISSRALYLAREGGDPVRNLLAAWIPPTDPPEPS
ncbi:MULTISPECIES: MBL fold metallo-hydrolase [Kitasatospora]|uniref:Glyoxylase-like metal-dependent hydrolase (Beta-lactamase superfamily II) n=2 Tax=Kitasatospora TaxID=2063 RepID=A0ABT1J0R2_9ACTN|nr:MBL fold metallo-hydrolase [Kitasatospora paracochleata]MCP2310992.1 glyoxylase-like metal-dependent hydrolase (beta-lactamase superfamily II) [Kitasatospora paracochleata]